MNAQSTSSTRKEHNILAPDFTPLSPVDMARLRQAIYRFLGMLVLYPNEARLTRVRTSAGELLDVSQLWTAFEYAPSFQRLLTALAGLNEEVTKQLEEEYNHLIKVKPVAPPYESFYLDPEGQVRGVIAGQLEEEYANAGLALSPSLLDMPDHLAVELEFMSFLCAGEVQARETEREADNVQVRIRQRTFLGQHLVKWFPQFARRITDAAPESLYSVAVGAAYAFLRYDLDYLGLRKP